MKFTLLQLLKQGSESLKNSGVLEAELDARYLLCEAFRLDTARFLMERAREMEQTAGNERAASEYFAMIKKRAERVPLQYITGSREFMGLDFLVNRDVLIPRQDTETLVEEVLKDHREEEKEIVDVCTGSGCIAVSLSALGGYRYVLGTDISPGALAVARKNGERLCGRSHVEFVESDMLKAVKALGRRFDVLVSNPPYIPTGVIRGLEPEVRDYEPAAALDGGPEGLYFYRILAGQCGAVLKPGGSVYFEIGFDQAGAVRELLRRAGFLGIEVIRDAAGKDRVVKAVYNN